MFLDRLTVWIETSVEKWRHEFFILFVQYTACLTDGASGRVVHVNHVKNAEGRDAKKFNYCGAAGHRTAGVLFLLFCGWTGETDSRWGEENGVH
jgi:hypothetical protein